ncbi:tetratricopeptide repeat protein [Yersinia rochesterensis]|uniref:tetratricopeptide repeat protein n=1 Tax=Yersinia rochesterensis TaxID=1604335 RepID=UPI00164384AC|nr:tetratricopeptide repeat protein [Yersinia rochesterensis]
MNRVLTVSFLSIFLTTSFYANAGQANIEVLSATIKDQKIANAQVVVQRNGEQSLTTVSDSAGKASYNGTYPDTSDNLVIIKKDGYSTLVAKCPCNGMSYALSPIMKGLDSMRVVLSWGLTPSDLDSHMVYSDNHLYFENKEGSNGNLDVDDTDSFGPETITLTKRENGQAYVYAVHDYSDLSEPETTNLSGSQAKVFVYVGESLVRTYYIPTGQKGNLWTVFRVNENGEIQDINSIKGISMNPSSLSGYLNPLLSNNAAFDQQTWGESHINKSKSLNLKGEAAYKEKNYENAIYFFTEAINNYSDNGKAYGNLGLTYQKAGRTAEAIWANRKAIALASGAGAPTIRAGANYNIGRVYEAANQYSDALTYYKAAKNEKQNPVYDNAIIRVNSKMN